MLCSISTAARTHCELLGRESIALGELKIGALHGESVSPTKGSQLWQRRMGEKAAFALEPDLHRLTLSNAEVYCIPEPTMPQ